MHLAGDSVHGEPRPEQRWRLHLPPLRRFADPAERKQADGHTLSDGKEVVGMERIVANLVQDFETGKINRRQLIRGLAVAASAAAGTTSVPAYAAGEPVLKATGILHVSYQVANYAKT